MICTTVDHFRRGISGSRKGQPLNYMIYRVGRTQWLRVVPSRIFPRTWRGEGWPLTVRANYENLLAHAGDRTRDFFSVRGDPTAARCLQFRRHHTKLQIHRGKQHVSAPQQPFTYQASQTFSHNDFSFGSKELLKDTAFHYLPGRPVVLIQEPESHTSGSSWKALMMMIAFITIKSSLVPLIEGLCAQI